MSKDTIIKLDMKHFFSLTSCILIVFMTSTTAFSKNKHVSHVLHKASVKKFPVKSSRKTLSRAGGAAAKHTPAKRVAAREHVNLKNAHKVFSRASLKKAEKRSQRLRISHHPSEAAAKSTKKRVIKSLALEHATLHHPLHEKRIAVASHHEVRHSILHKKQMVVASHRVRHPAFHSKHVMRHSRRLVLLHRHFRHKEVFRRALRSRYKERLASNEIYQRFHYSPSEYIKQKLQVDMKEYLGVPYRLGGCSYKGMDCSGFSRTVYADVFGVKLPHNSAEQFADPKLRSVSEKNLKTGDLIFFSKRKRINHVGIYLGNHRFIHATNDRGITISNLNHWHWKSLIAGTKRLLSLNIKTLHHRS